METHQPTFGFHKNKRNQLLILHQDHQESYGFTETHQQKKN